MVHAYDHYSCHLIIDCDTCFWLSFIMHEALSFHLSYLRKYIKLLETLYLKAHNESHSCTLLFNVLYNIAPLYRNDLLLTHIPHWDIEPIGLTGYCVSSRDICNVLDHINHWDGVSNTSHPVVVRKKHNLLICSFWLIKMNHSGKTAKQPFWNHLNWKLSGNLNLYKFE